MLRQYGLYKIVGMIRKDTVVIALVSQIVTENDCPSSEDSDDFLSRDLAMWTV